MNFVKRLLVLLVLCGSACIAAAASITNAQLFSWAAAAYSQFFSGTPAAAQFPPYDLRYYPGSQTFLAVDTSGNVYVYGPASGNALLNVGMVDLFAPAVTAWEATQTNTTNFSGTYYGQYTDSNGSGAFTMVIGTTGSVTGQGTRTCVGSCPSSGDYPLSGSIAAGGSLSFTTSGGDVCNGTAVSGGTISGTCAYAYNSSSGPFSGVRQIQAYTVQIGVTGSSAHVTNVAVCATVYDNDSCGPDGGFVIGQTGSIAVYGSPGGSYTVKIPANQPAASYCSVTSGSAGVFGSGDVTAAVTCQ